MGIKLPAQDIAALNENLIALRQSIEELRTIAHVQGASAHRHTLKPRTIAAKHAPDHPWHESTSISPVNDCIDALTANWFTNKLQMGGAKRAFPAVVSASEPVIKQVHLINMHKDTVKRSVNSIRKVRRNISETEIASSLDDPQELINQRYLHARYLPTTNEPFATSFNDIVHPITVIDEPIRLARYFFSPKRINHDRTVGEQLEICTKRWQNGDKSDTVAKGIHILSRLPESQIISERRIASYNLSANCKLGQNKPHWRQLYAYSPIFTLGNVGALSNIVDFSQIDLPASHFETEGADAPGQTKEYMPLLPEFDLYTRSGRG